MERYYRNELLIGKENQCKIENSKVAIFGCGGVGGFVLEALARCGVSSFVLVDKDVVDKTNINRQIIALSSTIGKPKVEVCKQRVLDINPKAVCKTYEMFFNATTKNEIDLNGVDFIVDAIDTVSSKLELILLAKEKNIKIISSMGTGNKLDASKFEICDISKTSVCPLAKVMRKELKKRNIESVKVLYSREEPKKLSSEEFRENGKQINGSISFVPSVAGLLIAGAVVREIISNGKWNI